MRALLIKERWLIVRNLRSLRQVHRDRSTAASDTSERLGSCRFPAPGRIFRFEKGCAARSVSARLAVRHHTAGKTAMNDTLTLSQRADALEQKMSDELDYILIKSRLYSLAEADLSPAPNA